MSTLASLTKKATKKGLPWGKSKESGDSNSGSKSKVNFSLGGKSSSTPAKKNPLSKSTQDREERKKIDAEAAAEVYAAFVASFEESPSAGKTFVRGNVINPETKEEIAPSQRKGALYKPTSRYAEVLKEKEREKATSGGAGILGAYPGEDDPPKPKRPQKGKAKSNLEAFKEELQREQEEREERHRLKRTLQQEALRIGTTPPALHQILREERDSIGLSGSHDLGDPQTTNLYVGNLSRQMNEELLCLTFGKYGPLASVKIMWPRTDEEKARNYMCGFVAFMCREDGSKALDALNGKEVMGMELKMGWGKAVPIPPVPFYVAPELQETCAAVMPPPPSGLPFNAQTRDTVRPGAKVSQHAAVPPPGSKGDEETSKSSQDQELHRLVIPVVVPHDINLLCVIHRVIEFVVREGPMFEAMLMNREINNPLFRFLFDNKEPAHIYYRWKLFSVLQGDRTDRWQLNEFRMFKGGSMWRPPPLITVRSNLQAPQVEDIVKVKEKEKRGQLSERQRDRLEDMLRDMSCERKSIADGMVFCLDHADSAEEIVDCITESLCIAETPVPLKAARLYLVSDILYNCSAGVPNASHFRRGLEVKLPEIFQHLGETLQGITGRLRANKFKHQVLTCIHAWEECAVYPPMFLIGLRAAFTGKESDHDREDVDGMPLADSEVGSDLDGAPLEIPADPDLDGMAMDDGDSGVDGLPWAGADTKQTMESFTAPADSVEKQRVPEVAQHPQMLSKWEMADDTADDSLDGDVLEQGAPVMDTIKSLSPSTRRLGALSADSERKRQRLREVEMKVVEYADRLEARAKIKGKPVDVQAELQRYREELLKEYGSSSSDADSEPDAGRYNLLDDSSSITAPGFSRRNDAHSATVSPRRSRSQSPSSPSSSSDSDSEASHRKRRHSPSSSSRKRRRHSPHRRRSPARRHRSRSRSRSPSRRHSRSRSRSPNSKRRKHKSSTSSHKTHDRDRRHSSKKKKK